MKIPKAALLTLLLGAPAFGSEQTARSESVVVKSGSLKLRGELWRPDGPGPFSAVLFNHGSARASTTRGGEEDRERRLREPLILGPAFVRHGYVFLFLFRHGGGACGSLALSPESHERTCSKNGSAAAFGRRVPEVSVDEAEPTRYRRGDDGLQGRVAVTPSRNFP